MCDRDELSEDYFVFDCILNFNLRSRYGDYDKIKSNFNFLCGKMLSGLLCSGIDLFKVFLIIISENRMNGIFKCWGIKNDWKLFKWKRVDLMDKEFVIDIYLGKGFKKELFKVDYNYLNLINVDIIIGVFCRDYEVKLKECNMVKGKCMWCKILVDEWFEFIDVLLFCYKSVRGKSLKRNYFFVKI